MTVGEIAKALDAQWLCGQEEEDRVVHYAFASDMMSDVLAYVQEDTVLLTGLVNSQSIRTAEMLDLPCVVFVRGKNPHQDAVKRAQELGIAALSTQYTMFETCGKLYTAGMKAVEIEDYDGDFVYD